MKFLTLINPHGKSMRRRRRRTRRFPFRSRRNPVRRRRTRTRIRRRTLAVVPRRRRRTRRRLAIARRSFRRVSRRRSRRGRRGFGGLSVRGLFSKDNLTLAGGIAASGLITAFIISKYGESLPGTRSADGSVNKWALIGYSAAIPIGASLVVKRFSPQLARGIALGGVVAVVNAVLNQALAATHPVAATSAYLSPQIPASAGSAGYQAVTQFSAAPSIYDSQSAFAADAWS